MSQPLPSPCASWGFAQQQQQQQTANTQGNCRTDLRAAYNRVLGALDSATATINGIASGLQDPSTGQLDVSTRLFGQPSRCTGRKRKLSPCVYDYNDTGFASSNKADTPTQELLPASRSELRAHQLQGVRWLASLDRQGASGILADEAPEDRRAGICGLLSHIASNPPHILAPPPMPAPTPAGLQRQQGTGHAGAPMAPPQPPPAPHAVLLLAPGGSLAGWSTAIREHVDVDLLLNDGSEAFASTLRAAAAAGPSDTTHGAPALGRSGLTPSRRGAAATGASAPGTSAAGVYGPQQLGRPGGLHPATPHHHARLLGMSSKPLVVLSPLEQLQRDAGLLSSLPQRVLVVDLAARGGGGSGGSAGRGSDAGSGGAACGSGGGDGGGLFAVRCAPGDSSGGSGCGPGGQQEGEAGRGRRGMELDSLPALQLLCRMPAASRVLLSAGEPEPVPGDSIWLLLELLAPNVRQQLWQAVSELQQALLAPENVHYKDNMLTGLHSRLWALLRPLQLYRRARDFDLANMRAASTNLNLFDHFSAARSDGSL